MSGLSLGNRFSAFRLPQNKKQQNTKSAMSRHDLDFHFNVRDKADD